LSEQSWSIRDTGYSSINGYTPGRGSGAGFEGAGWVFAQFMLTGSETAEARQGIWLFEQGNIL